MIFINQCHCPRCLCKKTKGHNNTWQKTNVPRGWRGICRKLTSKLHLLYESIKKKKPLLYYIGGSSVVGVSTGLGMLRPFDTECLDDRLKWPQYVKSRIYETYSALGSFVLMSVFWGTCMAIRGSELPMIFVVVSSLGLIPLANNVAARFYDKDYKRSKTLLCMLALMVGVLATVAAAGTRIGIQVLSNIASTAGGLSLYCMWSPATADIGIGGPISMSFSFLLSSMISNTFLPTTAFVRMGHPILLLYGGLAFYSLTLMYNTKRLVHEAKTQPFATEEEKKLNNADPFNPIYYALSIATKVLYYDFWEWEWFMKN